MRSKFQINTYTLTKFIGNWILDIRNWKFNSGFTLIELLIVISMISILSAGLISLIDPIGKIQRANDARRKTDLSQIQRALELYYDDNGKYPVAAGGLIKDGSETKNWNDPWPPYMARIPEDPASPKKDYFYDAPATGQSFQLYTSLDNEHDQQKDCGGTCNLPPGATCGADPCNYGVSSPNITP